MGDWPSDDSDPDAVTPSKEDMTPDGGDPKKPEPAPKKASATTSPGGARQSGSPGR